MPRNTETFIKDNVQKNNSTGKITLIATHINEIL